jgi:hypothetical protein
MMTTNSQQTLIRAIISSDYVRQMQKRCKLEKNSTGSVWHFSLAFSVWQFGSAGQFGSGIQFAKLAIWFSICHGRSACMFGLNNCLHAVFI